MTRAGHLHGCAGCAARDKAIRDPSVRHALDQMLAKTRAAATCEEGEARRAVAEGIR